MTFDKRYDAWVRPIRCPCCERCWLVVRDDERPRRVGRCVFGGPYGGYEVVNAGTEKHPPPKGDG